MEELNAKLYIFFNYVLVNPYLYYEVGMRLPETKTKIQDRSASDRT